MKLYFGRPQTQRVNGFGVEDPQGRKRTAPSNCGTNDAVLRFDGPDGGVPVCARASANTSGGPTEVPETRANIPPHSQAERQRGRWETAVAQAAEVVLALDETGQIEYVNPAFERVTGFSPGESLGHKWSMLCSDEHETAFYREMRDTLAEGDTWRGHITLCKRDGSPLELDTVVSPVRSAADHALSFVSVSRDVTREMQLESQLLQSQKMEAMGILAGGIAHDFNNILQALLGYTELARAEVKEDSRAASHMAAIYTAAERASDLVRRILAFSRRTEQERCPVRMDTILQEVAKLLRGSLPSTIEIRLNIADDSGVVLGDPSQLHQVLMNLATNAYHAMRDKGGVLEMGIETMELNEQSASSYPGLKPGRFTKLIVGDTGCGMSESTMTHIFEPYFTTKRSGEGTGLGLAVVLGIIKSHGGTITVDSRLGTGSIFSILLPQRSPNVGTSEHAPSAGLTQGGGERILLIDDEEAIVRAETQVFEGLGYHVTGYTDSAAAIEAFRKDPYAFDVVITDQTMPHLTGIELAREMLQLRPELPVVLCTGYSDTLNEGHVKKAGICQYLMKPASRDELASILRKAIAKA